MAIIIKGNVQGDVISDGGVKNETHYHYGDEHNVEHHEKKKVTHVDMTSQCQANMVCATISAPRQEILDQLLALVDKGDWKHDGMADGVKNMMLTVLGQGKTPLIGKEAEMSEALWHLLENQRGDRVKIVWQNIVGYLDEKKLFPTKGSPALNRDFFGSDDGYTNIDKGRPSRDNMSNGFRDVLPLLEAYVPKP